MIVAGIDPGVSGALFMLASETYALDVPTLKQKVASKKAPREVPDYHRWMASWSDALREADHIFVELVSGGSYGKGQAQSGMFKFGYAAGFALGIVVGSGTPYSFITAQSWKRIVGLPSGSEKDDSRRRACQLIPGAADLFTRKKDVGRAEAALIGYAGRMRDFQGGLGGGAHTGGGRPAETA